MLYYLIHLPTGKRMSQGHWVSKKKALAALNKANKDFKYFSLEEVKV